MKKKLLFANKQNFSDDQFAKLEDLGLDVILLDGKDQQSYDMDFSDIDAVVCFKFFDFNDIEKFKSLKFVHTTSTGIDQMPQEYLREHGIILKNCPGIHSAPISEFVVGAVLCIYKKFDKLKKQQENHIWKCDWDLHELIGRRVLIIGTGSIGSHCARKFKAFDTTVVGVNRSAREDINFDKIYTMDKLDEELEKADIIVSCLPLSDETYHLIDKHCFDLMKDDAVFVNISRGGVVDIDALAETLNSGKLMGAALDVFEEEPLPETSEYWDVERLIITPHNSFSGEGNPERIFSSIYNDLKDWLESID